jgi:archaellum component FlaG (FlaF/FlaG flagellin family)
VTADIANKSTVNGNKQITVYVNGEIETTQGLTLNSGDSSKLTFNVSRSEPGTYKVYVDGAPAGSFKVEAVTASDAILIASVAFLAIAFVCGLFIMRRRQGITHK